MRTVREVAELAGVTPGQIQASPDSVGLTGAASWFLLSPAPQSEQLSATLAGEAVTGNQAGADAPGQLLVLALMIPSGVKTASAMLNINLGYEETTQLGFIFHAHPNATDRHWQNAYAHVSAMDRYLAGLHLPDGDVVVDNSSGCVPQMLTTIEQPKLFVIPNDRDFQRILADPISFHTHYIMEEDPATGGVTAVNLQYPNLWTSGAGFTKMVHEFPAGGNCDAFRLFRVLHHSGDVG